MELSAIKPGRSTRRLRLGRLGQTPQASSPWDTVVTSHGVCKCLGVSTVVQRTYILTESLLGGPSGSRHLHDHNLACRRMNVVADGVQPWRRSRGHRKPGGESCLHGAPIVWVLTAAGELRAIQAQSHPGH